MSKISELTDSVVGFFNPERAARRRAFRALNGSKRFNRMISNLTDGRGGSPYYRGSRKGRSLGEWATDDGTGNDHLRRSLPDLRNDSNDLLANNAIARGAINTFRTNIVGTGLQLSPTIDAEFLGLTDDEAEAWEDRAEREFRLFCKSCDQSRTRSFVELQGLALASQFVNGDVFCNIPMIHREGIRYETTLNMIEGHRICSKPGVPESDRLVMGVELDEYGCPTGYQYTSTVDIRKPREWRRLRAFDDNGNPLVLHIYRKDRVSQNRGIPILAPIIELIKKVDTYSQAEVDAAVINAFLTVFIMKRSADDNNPLDVVSNMSDETGAESTDDDITMGSGVAIEMSKDDESIEVVDPNRPNVNFDAFVKAVIAQIAIALNLPYEVLMKTFQSSYSASKGAVIEAVKVFDEWERFLIDSFCQPVYEAFLIEAIAKGWIEAPGFFTDPLVRQAYCEALWIGPAQNELDPTKGAKAATARMSNGTSNLVIEAARSGRSLKQVMRGAKRARRMAEQFGVNVDFIVDNETSDSEKTGDSK